MKEILLDYGTNIGDLIETVFFYKNSNTDVILKFNGILIKTKEINCEDDIYRKVTGQSKDEFYASLVG